MSFPPEQINYLETKGKIFKQATAQIEKAQTSNTLRTPWSRGACQAPAAPQMGTHTNSKLLAPFVWSPGTVAAAPAAHLGDQREPQQLAVQERGAADGRVPDQAAPRRARQLCRIVPRLGR